MLSVYEEKSIRLSCVHEQPHDKNSDFVEVIPKHATKNWIDLDQDTKSEFMSSIAHNVERWTKLNPIELIVVTCSDTVDYPVPGSQSADIDDFELSKAAFKKFVESNRHNPRYADKYVVFVHGRLYDVGDTEVELIKKVYHNVGNVAMYVGSVSREIQTELIESPELL